MSPPPIEPATTPPPPPAPHGWQDGDCKCHKLDAECWSWEYLAPAEGGEAPLTYVAGGPVEPGMRVEVEMEDEGMQGSRYAGVVVGVRSRATTEALVRYEALFGEPTAADSEPPLQEWLDSRLLSPPPPPQTIPKDWLKKVCPSPPPPPPPPIPHHTLHTPSR